MYNCPHKIHGTELKNIKTGTTDLLLDYFAFTCFKNKSEKFPDEPELNQLP